MGLKKLGRYDIVRVLGEGAMGLLYEARDPNLDRRVAIKTIRVENLSGQAQIEYEARFRTEARSAARLQHPNIVSVYDSGRDRSVAYLVMEFVHGEDLKQLLDSGRVFTLEQSLRMMRDLLAALDYAHRQSVVHRDVKPANLLVEASGRVKLTDFGVARIQDSGEATRTKGSMVGTLKHMSPEQVQGQAVDARADLFSAGIVLYQLLTGKRPFDGDSQFAIIQQIVGVMPPAPSSVNSRLPVALDAVVERALAKSRDERYASAHEFAHDLLHATRGLQDLTIVPPLSSGSGGFGDGMGPGAYHSANGAASGRQAAGREDSDSTIKQEIELVYWKDVKDSDDSEDVRDFLDRFPSGIYANLARRRLRKLREGTLGEQSITQASTIVLPRAMRGGDDATIELRHEGAPSRPDAVGAVAPPPPAPGASAEAGASGPSSPEAAAAPAQGDAPIGRPTSAIPGASTTSAPKRRLAIGIAAMTTVLLGVALFWSSGSGPGPLFPAGVAGASDVAPVADSALAPNPVSVDAAGSGLAPPGAIPADPNAAATTQAMVVKPRLAASKVPAPKADTTPDTTAVTLAPADKASPLGATSPPNTASVAAPPLADKVAGKMAGKVADKRPVLAGKTAAAAGPEQACRGRILLGFQMCLTEQCASAQWSGDPVCTERALAAKAQQDARSERN